MEAGSQFNALTNTIGRYVHYHLWKLGWREHLS